MRDLNAMAVFAEVVKAGSFSAAAENLSMTLSTVSRKVARLESDLSVKLLERTTRKLRLTEIGSRYYEGCLRGLEGLRAANALVDELQSEVSGKLRISVPPNLAEDLFVPAIGRFQHRYPEAFIQVFVTERILDFVDDEVDLSFRVGLWPDSSLVTRKLAAYRHRLVASPSYLSERGMPALPGELKAHTLIGFGFWSKPDLQWKLTRKKESTTVSFIPNISFNDYAALQSALIRGLGIGELPSILCQGALEKRALVEVLPEWQFPEIELRAVHTGSKNLPRLVRLFLDMCAEHIQMTLKP